VDNLLRRGDTAIYEKLLQTFEKEVIASALRFTNGKKIEAANLMGIGRNTITRKISELGLSVEKRKEEASS
jgi:two-component system nitrogen regulation response regulator GlnG